MDSNLRERNAKILDLHRRLRFQRIFKRMNRKTIENQVKKQQPNYEEDEHQFIPVDDSLDDTTDATNNSFVQFDIVEINGEQSKFSESVIVPQCNIVIKTEPEDIEIDEEKIDRYISGESSESDEFEPATVKIEPEDIDETQLESTDDPKIKSPIAHEQKQTNKKKELRCEICDKTFKYRKSYKQHRLDHKVKNDMLSCKICGKLLKPTAMDYHMNYRHTEERRFQCVICGRRFKSPGAMKHHVVTQHRDEDNFQFECRECLTVFDSSETLAKHVSLCHSVSMKIADMKKECKYCNEIFENQQKLTLHIGVLGKLGKCRNTIQGESSSTS